MNPPAASRPSESPPPFKEPLSGSSTSSKSRTTSFSETLSTRGASPGASPPACPSEAPSAVPDEPLPVEGSGVAVGGSQENAPPAPPPETSASSATAFAVARGDHDESGSSDGSPRRGARPDPLDPAARHAAQMVPFNVSPMASATSSPSPAAPSAEAQAHASLETLLPELVRKVAWSGDGRRGTMRLELGAGALAGGTLVVHADDGRVRVELDAPSGTDVTAWKARLLERLAERGVTVDEIDVR